MALHFVRTTAVLIALSVSSARAVEVLDQQNDLTGSAAADTASPGAVETGQTFTVGVAGTLTRIEAQVNKIFLSGGGATLTVYNTASGIPQTSLGTAFLPEASIPSGGYAFQSFDLSAFDIPVNVGDFLAFTITSAGAGYGLRSSFDTSTYAGGHSLWRVIGASTWTVYSPSHDNGFKTYVDVAEPVGTPGDFNDDAVVNAADYPIWRKHFNEPSETALNGNGDGMNGVEEGDYDLWREHFAEPANGQAASVPEPNAALFCLSTLFALLPDRRRD